MIIKTAEQKYHASVKRQIKKQLRPLRNKIELVDYNTVVNQWKDIYLDSVTVTQQTAMYIPATFKDDGFLWHVFSYQAVPSLQGDQALTKLNELFQTKTPLYCFFEETDIAFLWNDYSSNDIEKLTVLLEGQDDVHFTTTDFKETFVHTHESELGPFYSNHKMIQK